jgi:hypothetical protein
MQCEKFFQKKEGKKKKNHKRKKENERKEKRITPQKKQKSIVPFFWRASFWLQSEQIRWWI